MINRYNSSILSKNRMKKLLKCSEESIKLASECIKNGGIIVYPTDTIYGLGADPYNKDAIEKVFSIKERDKTKPLPLLCSSLKHINRIVDLNLDAKRLAERFWPGALTIIAKLKDRWLVDIFDIEKGAVRIPNNKCALKLIDVCNGILIGTSANISGYKSIKDVRELDIKLLKRVDIVIDDGITLGIESTIIDVIDKKIIREGYLKKEHLEEVLGYEL